jgi:hypothetical protein
MNFGIKTLRVTNFWIFTYFRNKVHFWPQSRMVRNSLKWWNGFRFNLKGMSSFLISFGNINCNTKLLSMKTSRGWTVTLHLAEFLILHSMIRFLVAAQVARTNLKRSEIKKCFNFRQPKKFFFQNHNKSYERASTILLQEIKM